MKFLNTLFKTKEKPIESYKDFWNWFSKNQKGLYQVIKEQKGDIEADFLDRIIGKLNELCGGIYILAGMLDEDTVEIIFSAEGVIKNIVFAEELVAAAPVIKGWKFTALKPIFKGNDANIAMEGYEFNSDNIHFYSNINTAYPDEIDITVIHDDFTEENKRLITNGTYIFLDHLLGELNFATIIDEVTIKGKAAATDTLVPITKLSNFLIWRQKEFVEKYEGVRGYTNEDVYSMLQAQLENGDTILFVVNTNLLEWDSKASHPWILNIEIKYDGADNKGMPEDETYQLLNQMEDELMIELKDIEGYLNIGRQTGGNIKKIFFACKEFRKVSKTMVDFQKKYSDQLEISYDIYKDKFWSSFDNFRKPVI